jgi:peptide/nickel transport system substrate-binding protein
MVKYKVFTYPEKAVPSVEADGAASWEISPDGMTYTFKVRPNQKYDPRPPTSGRTLNSGDIKFSWDRYEALNPFRTYLANKADKIAPVTSVTTPDTNTAVFNLAFPYAPFLSILAYSRTMAIIPVEAADKFDVKSDMRGTGPWRLKEFVPSARVSYEPNPDWYDASKMKFSTLNYYNIPEYAAELAQFRTGNLATISEMPQSDILPTKRDLPATLLKQVDNFELAHDTFRFSYLPGSPFLDERVRKAVSMLIDRDLSIDTMNETQQFKDAGFKIETRWNSAIICGEPWWMDPRGKDFGPEAKWFTYDPAEAKKLLRAAGHTTAIKVPFGIRNEQGAVYEREAQIMHGMLIAHGDFDMPFQVRDYRSDWRANVHYGYNKHEGIAFGFFSSTMPDVDLPLLTWYQSGMERTGHVAADGKPDAIMDGLIARQRAETDLNKRAEILNEFQRYAAKTMYTIMGPGDSTRFELGHAWLGNWGVYRTYAGSSGSLATEVFPYMYIDQSKKA